MKRFFCLTLAAVMLCFLLSGCSNTLSLEGTWETQIDLVHALQTVVQSDSLTENTYMVTTQLVFCEDGTFTLTPDATELSTALSSLLNNLTGEILDDLKEEITDSGTGVNDFLALFGTDVDKLTEKLQGELDLGDQLEALFENATATGYYKATGSRLFLYQEEDSKLPSSYIQFTLEENALTLQKHIGTNPFITQNILFKSMPMTFTKAQS